MARHCPVADGPCEIACAPSQTCSRVNGRNPLTPPGACIHLDDRGWFLYPPVWSSDGWVANTDGPPLRGPYTDRNAAAYALRALAACWELPDGTPVFLESYRRYGSTCGDVRWSIEGEVIRVIVAADVLALPAEGWAYPGFGSGISAEWLMERTPGYGKLPGKTKGRRLRLAHCAARALRLHHDQNAPAALPGELGRRW